MTAYRYVRQGALPARRERNVWVVEEAAGAACRALAQKTGGLLSTTLPARGLFHDDPYCLGISGSFTPEVGLEYLAQADLVIAVGCSLAYHAGGGGQLWPKAKMLQVDVLVVEAEQEVFAAMVALKAGQGSFADAIIAALGTKAGCSRTLTFDRKALRLPGFEHP